MERAFSVGELSDLPRIEPSSECRRCLPASNRSRLLGLPGCETVQPSSPRGQNAQQMKRVLILLTLAAGLCIPVHMPAQIPVPPPAPDVPMRSAAELDQMLGPIALYPDPLIAQILPAATLPSEIVLADRYVSGGGDPSLVDQQGWDPKYRHWSGTPRCCNGWTIIWPGRRLWEKRSCTNPRT